MVFKYVFNKIQISDKSYVLLYSALNIPRKKGTIME